MKTGKLSSYFALELRRARALVKRIYTGKRDLESLPNALQEFILRSGCTTAPNIHQVKVEWKNAQLKMAIQGTWKAISCIQHNFLPDPIRLVYMKTKLFGIVSMEAFDSFRHGKGSMIIKMARFFNILTAVGSEMDKAELVTILAETMLIPDYALQHYMQWQELDSHTIKGTINYHGLTASGIFYFNPNFEALKFETSDRIYTDPKGNFVAAKWTATCGSYVHHGNLKFPTDFTATWNFPSGDHTYFRGQIANITLNP